MPRVHQFQHALLRARILQLIHIPREQRERHRPRNIDPCIFQLALNKNRHRNQPARRRLGYVTGPLIHPHCPNHLLRLRNLVHLPPRRNTRAPPHQHRTSQPRAKEKISHKLSTRLDAISNPKSHSPESPPSIQN
jgi:hypothetical protein